MQTLREESPNQISLPVDELPHEWYNIVPDLPTPLPPPQQPTSGPDRMKSFQRIMTKACFQQETSTERWIPIPEGIRDLYIQAGRPRPLMRARRLERFLKTPARLYYKREDLSPTGSHKVNTALPQAYYAAQEGFEEVATETGAGQWGTALSYAARLVNLKPIVFWVRAVANWKPARKALMRLYGADVYDSPSNMTSFGRSLLKENPNHPGSLGIAISEGLEYTLANEKTVYCLGSVLNHVLTHQTIIGLETKKQFELADDYPDIVVSCLGGGSNFGGFAIPFLNEAIKKNHETRFIAAQTEAAPNLTKGKYEYDFGDVAEHTPLLKMYTLGHKKEMPPVRGDGLRYHAAAPILSLLKEQGFIEAKSYPTDEKHVFERAQQFIQTEGFIPAPESAYSIAAAIDEALEAKKKGTNPVIAFNISGHGFLDMQAYQDALLKA